MDNSITQREPTAAEKLLAWHPSTKATVIAMTETPQSSQIAAWGYHPESKTLRVRFKFGLSEYDYHWVDQAKADEMAKAESLGTFLGQELKDVHHYERIKEPVFPPRKAKR